MHWGRRERNREGMIPGIRENEAEGILVGSSLSWEIGNSVFGSKGGGARDGVGGLKRVRKM